MKGLCSCGVSRPEIKKPFTGSGGYVIGTLTTPTRRPCRLRHAHSESASRNEAFVKRKPRPSLSGSKKSNKPCFPGFLPVMKLDQAHGVMGGMVDSSRLHAPSESRRAKFGSRPS